MKVTLNILHGLLNNTLKTMSSIGFSWFNKIRKKNSGDFIPSKVSNKEFRSSLNSCLETERINIILPFIRKWQQQKINSNEFLINYNTCNVFLAVLCAHLHSIFLLRRPKLYRGEIIWTTDVCLKSYHIGRSTQRQSCRQNNTSVSIIKTRLFCDGNLNSNYSTMSLKILLNWYRLTQLY